MQTPKERLIEIVESMPEYEDPEKLVFDLYKKYIELYGKE